MSEELANLNSLVKIWQKQEAKSDNDGIRMH